MAKSWNSQMIDQPVRSFSTHSTISNSNNLRSGVAYIFVMAGRSAATKNARDAWSQVTTVTPDTSLWCFLSGMGSCHTGYCWFIRFYVTSKIPLWCRTRVGDCLWINFVNFFFHPKVMPPFSIHQTYHPPLVPLTHRAQEQTPPWTVSLWCLQMLEYLDRMECRSLLIQGGPHQEC